MNVIAGFALLFTCVLLGFAMAAGGGHGLADMLGKMNFKAALALVHANEFISLGGMVLGSMIVSAPVKVLKGVVSQALGTLKGAPFSKADYEELMKCLYELFQLGRRGGMIALEEHVMNPEGSSLFSKYPKFHGNHHAVEFLCDALRPIVDGRLKPDQLPPLLNKSLHIMEEEHHAPLHVMQATADALPAFGIVAAVLGIIVVMMYRLGGDTTLVGQGIATALAGTFFGIFGSYCVIAPVKQCCESRGHAEMVYFNCIREAVLSFANGLPPMVACEVARRVLTEEVRPSAGDLETMLKTAG